jgi:hypothetical protein
MAPPPSLHLVGSSSNFVLALSDPTLFALPHRQTFSGQAWLSFSNQAFEPFLWTEEARWLDLNSAELGDAFRKAIENQPATIPPLVTPVGERQRLPELLTAEPFSTNSTLRLGLGLAKRHLKNKFALRSWPHTDILTNSVVQVLLDAEGQTVSCTLLPPGCGLNEADQQALAFARAARFQPTRVEGPNQTAAPGAGLTLGQMIFQWHTLLLPDTNSQARGN